MLNKYVDITFLSTILEILFLHCCQHILALLGKGQSFRALSGVRPSTFRTVVEEVVDNAGHNNT